MELKRLLNIKYIIIVCAALVLNLQTILSVSANGLQKTVPGLVRLPAHKPEDMLLPVMSVEE